ncbi:hypothetical protein FQN60_004587 [Etheostoma spectabile]|uniref:Uncharacterized protein n=1 Tax=Etheostoma spectabile TaxID=54343 RepID=A0A5J5DKD5_9PERO|nr:hypothetical protein FQN60_004587 [Etheostoma spectabile]
MSPFHGCSHSPKPEKGLGTVSQVCLGVPRFRGQQFKVAPPPLLSRCFPPRSIAEETTSAVTPEPSELRIPRGMKAEHRGGEVALQHVVTSHYITTSRSFQKPFHTRVGNSNENLHSREGASGLRSRKLLLAKLLRPKCFIAQRLPRVLGLLYNETEQNRAQQASWEQNNTSAGLAQPQPSPLRRELQITLHHHIKEEMRGRWMKGERGGGVGKSQGGRSTKMEGWREENNAVHEEQEHQSPCIQSGDPVKKQMVMINTIPNFCFLGAVHGQLAEQSWDRGLDRLDKRWDIVGRAEDMAEASLCLASRLKCQTEK